MQTYLFYDIETTGLSKSFDQVLHFAAIRTDLNLNEIDRYELKVKLNPDVIPAPQAIITHKMGIKEISTGVSEFDAIRQIHQWLNEPGTISLGYNTLGFDDEFLRFSFFRNLLKPYTHQYANQCGRMDIYPMAVMFFLYKNSVIKWPQRDGKQSLKLEEINAANQLISGRSHHAMVDVEVTLELARRFSAEREMWEYLHGSFNKQIDLTRMQPLQNDIALVVDGIFGAQNFYQCPAIFLGPHKHYKNQLVWLRLDSPDLIELAENSMEKIRVINKKPGEPDFMLPFKDKYLQHLSSERISQMEKNRQWLREHPSHFKSIASYFTNYKYPSPPNTDVDASLYLHGFWNFEEELFCQRFHSIKPNERAKLVEQVANPRLTALAVRVLGRNFPELLTFSQAEKFANYMRHVFSEQETLVDFKGNKRITPKFALEEIQLLRNQPGMTAEAFELLQGLEEYLHTSAQICVS